MDTSLQPHLKNLWATDRDLQNAAYHAFMAAAEKPVDWAYEVWDACVANLTHPDNHNRAIAAQLLARLAISDPQKRILTDFDALLNITRDPRFVTARHALQSLWRVGLAGEEPRACLLKGLQMRYAEAAVEKNGSLIRFDILTALRELYDALGDESLRATAQAWIEQETDPKYRKKFAAVWKK